jgi:hypothetical protein
MLLETGSQPRMLVETPTLPQMGEITRPNMLAIRRKRRTTIGVTAALLLGVAAGAVFLLRHQTHSRAAITPPGLTHVDSPSSPTKLDGPAPGAMAATPAPSNDDTMAVGTPKVHRPASTTTLASAAVPTRVAPPLRGGRRPGGATPVAGNGSPAVDPDPPAPVAPTPQPQVTPTPAPQPVAVAPDPTPAPAPVPAAPAPTAFDPANARMSVGGVNTDRMSPRDVSAIMGRGDLKSCYVASVKGGESASPGPITLNLEVEDMRVSKARASGGASSPSLRKCLESRLIGARVPSADTGSATASIPLTFSTQ